MLVIDSLQDALRLVCLRTTVDVKVLCDCRPEWTEVALERVAVHLQLMRAEPVEHKVASIGCRVRALCTFIYAFLQASILEHIGDSIRWYQASFDTSVSEIDSLQHRVTWFICLGSWSIFSLS